MKLERFVMRTIAQIPHALMRITVLSWNEKYQLRYELDRYEQVYKFDQSDTNLEQVKTIGLSMSDEVLRQFVAMRSQFQKEVNA